MTVLAIPDPRTEIIPPGWWEAEARPVIEACDNFDALDDLEAELRVYISIIEALEGDKVEFEKALRVIEMRRGQLLAPRRPGARTDLMPRGDACLVPSEPLTRGGEVPDASRQTLSKWRTIAENWAVIEPVIRDATRPHEVTQAQVLRVVRDHTPAKVDVLLPDAPDGRISLLHGPPATRLGELADGSVDLIVTDPGDDVDACGELAMLAARLLGPRGVAFVWCGLMRFPAALDRFAEHLTYGWTFAVETPGAGSRVMGRRMMQGWRPVVAWSTGTWPAGQWGDDVLVAPPIDDGQAPPSWQYVAPARQLIERYSPPDGLVVDPFLGDGAFGHAAAAAGRRFVGVEADAARLARARERVIA